MLRLVGIHKGKQMIGMRFNRLTVVAGPEVRKGKRYWACACACGGSSVVLEWRIKSGWTTSCGCLKGGRLSHGQCEHPLYETWCSMRSRCNDPRNTSYAYYGGRGICVCDRWDSFDLFLKDMGEKPSPTHTLDRIDNDGNYEPENCRWATPQEQYCNRRTTGVGSTRRLYELNGIIDSSKGWASRLGMNTQTLRNKLWRGKSLEEIAGNRITMSVKARR